MKTTRRWPGLLLIGAAYRDAGKTRLATTLIGRFASRGPVFGAKVTVIHPGGSGGCARGGEGCGVCSSLGGAPYVLTEEHGELPDKDTARMLAAGATRVLWLRVAKPHLAEGRDVLMAALGTDHPVVCESNTFRQAVEPDVFVVLRRAGSTAMKPSCAAVLPLADALLDTDEERPCVWADAFSLVDGRWGLHRDATAVVLAGGASSRMGRDKALLELDGRPLIERLVRALEPHFAEVLISARRAEDYAFLGCPVVADPVSGQGPLLGMATALAAARHERVFFTPCDLATPPIDLAGRLLRELRDADVVLPRHADGKLEPLVAVLRRTMGPVIERTLARGDRKILLAYADARVRYVDLPDGDDLSNLNTEADYDEARRRQEAAARKEPDGTP